MWGGGAFSAPPGCRCGRGPLQITSIDLICHSFFPVFFSPYSRLFPKCSCYFYFLGGPPVQGGPGALASIAPLWIWPCPSNRMHAGFITWKSRLWLWKKEVTQGWQIEHTPIVVWFPQRKSLFVIWVLTDHCSWQIPEYNTEILCGAHRHREGISLFFFLGGGGQVAHFCLNTFHFLP